MFVPPKGFRCDFAVASTMSQDTDALELIMETLSGKSAYELKTIDRDIKLALIYDNTSGIVESQKLGGLYPIRIKNRDRLLHAKMALIKYKSNDEHLHRLIVFTGNFTMASLSQQIEMVWCHNYKESDNYINDLIEAGKFIKDLLNQHCVNCDVVQKKVDSLLNGIIDLQSGNEKSRFIHSLKMSMMSQAIEQFQRYNKKNKGKHNYLSLGTPFFQNELKPDNFVVSEILRELKKGILISQHEDTFLQTIGPSLTKSLGDACKNDNIKIYSTCDKRRSLHSKYIHVARYDKSRLSSNVFYVGSGNLTINGFKEVQNIECGIVFEHADYINEKDYDEAFYFSDEIEYSDLRDEGSGGNEELKKECLTISVVSATRKERVLILSLADKEDYIPFKVMSQGEELGDVDSYPGESVEIALDDNVLIFDTITIVDQYGLRYPVLVFGSDGLPQKVELVKRGFDEVFSLLKTYPNFDPVNEEEEFDRRDIELNLPDASEEEIINHRKSFALFNFTELIEHIARENELIKEDSIDEWANTLKFTLIDCLKEEDKMKMAKLGASKLSILKEKGFTPSVNTENMAPYLRSLDAIIGDWEAAV